MLIVVYNASTCGNANLQKSTDRNSLNKATYIVIYTSQVTAMHLANYIAIYLQKCLCVGI